ncbi:hypothetical protein VTN77DRAFT_91 [Rasamsonia byssochlamydoides]|uniref:uncharacterized protein n=1 Tax=Rasamsonia byssochlamydoides TaxID=89139 RepID=UPI0037438594
MAALHEALQGLGPISWDTIPTDSPDELRAYTANIFKKSRLIVETVPEPSTGSDVNLPSSKKSAVSSSSHLASLQKEWGKPIKINNAKENPLGITMYKLPGKDAKGAWFARRSIHEGLPFSRWKAKMQIEMDETLKARQEEIRRGQTPETSIRGIGGDKKLEKVEIRDASQENVLGCIAVYQLSAQFPGPTTPRDFVTLMITTDRADDDEDDTRSYLIVSKPCDHPDAPPRGGYIRGQYESVEFIREIPLKSSKNKTSATARVQGRPGQPRAASFPARLEDQGDTRSEAQPDLASDKSTPAHSTPGGRKRGTTETAVQGQREWESDDEAEEEDGDATNPVEWIMITRSDPGGSVPRWMVERGTPKSIALDAAKFLTWASQPDQPEETVQSAERRESISSLLMNGRLAGIDGTYEEDKLDAVETDSGAKQLNESIDNSLETSSDDDDDEEPTENGLWASVTSLIQTGLESYAPRAVLNYIPGHSPKGTESKSRNITVPVVVNEGSAQGDDGDHDDAASLMSNTSNDTFTSADSNMLASGSEDVPRGTAGQGPYQSISSTSLEGSSTGLTGLKNSTEGLFQSSDRKSKPTSHEKELAKLASRKKEVEAKLTTVRSEIKSLGHRPPKDGAESGPDSDRASTTSSMHKQDSNNTKAQAAVQDQKRIARLSRTESKLVSQLRKIEAQQFKAANKLESRQRKEEQRREKARSRSEIDDLRREVEDLKKQVRDLRDERERWVDLVGRLQRENTKLVAENSRGSLRGGKEEYGTD